MALAEFTLKQFADFAPCQVHRRKYDVIRRFVTQLHDEFAEVVFNDFEAGLFQRVIQMYFFGGHGLGLDDGTRLFLADDLQMISPACCRCRPNEPSSRALRFWKQILRDICPDD